MTVQATGIPEAEDNLKKSKYLIFLVGERRLAVPAQEVREICITTDIFRIPFVPKYIRGLINRHGDPYTVLDIKLLLENESFEGSKFIIFRPKDRADHLALMITDVVEFVDVKDKELHKMHQDDDELDFYYGTITLNQEEICVLHAKKILEQLEKDL
jgi:purine-binding chemotaxis protein CheW